MHKKILGAAALVAIASAWVAPAVASPIVISGYVDTSYAYSSVSNGGGNVNNWNINGAGTLPVASNFGLQLNGGFNDLTFSHGVSENAGNVVGSGIYADHWGRIGASVGYAQANVEHGSINATNYGVFGDWYAGDMFTLSARGGGISGSGHEVFEGNGSFSGAYYVGGQATGYVLPNLAVVGTIDYFNIPIRHFSLQSTSYSIGGQYLVSQQFPLAVTAGYTYNTLDIPHGGNGNDNTFSIGLKYYFGSGGSLVDHQRSGSEGWGAAAPIQYIF
jgi:hypothetical protein